MQEVTIRNYMEKDKSAVRNICVLTANGYPVATEEQRELLCLAFNDYYTENEADSCFVAANANDEAIGYIICAKDFSTYENIFCEQYLPKIKKLNRIQAFIRRIGIWFEGRISDEYPAHLHINIIDGYQRMGLGHKLMSALIAYLKASGIAGVCLFVGAKNQKGINFYKKYGFTEVTRVPGAICFGLKLIE